MIRIRHAILFLVSTFGLWVADVDAENWPCWRGPRGDGTVVERGTPIQWDVESGRNIAWKTAVPGKGHSSPVVWGNDLFLTTCIEETQERLLLCYDVTTGREKWQRRILNSPLETLHKLNSFASGTPATDGELVYVAFLKVDGSLVEAPNVGAPRDITPGRVILSAVDFEAKMRWQVDLGEFVSAHGFCSCPVLYKDLVIVNGDHDGDSYIVAIDKKTGNEVWRQKRENGIRSYVTPIVRTINKRDELVLSGSEHVTALDPTTGEMIWKVEGPTEQFVASMVFDGERFLLAAGYPTHHVMAIRAGGVGDITSSHVAWHVDNHVRCYVPSPVLVDHHLFVADDRGTASCFDSRTGERLWNDRLASSFDASLVATQDHVYFHSGDGVTQVIDPKQDFAVIAENAIHERCNASIAVSNQRLFIRGETHLFCIANLSGDPSAGK